MSVVPVYKIPDTGSIKQSTLIDAPIVSGTKLETDYRLSETVVCAVGANKSNADSTQCDYMVLSYDDPVSNVSFKDVKYIATRVIYCNTPIHATDIVAGTGTTGEIVIEHKSNGKTLNIHIPTVNITETVTGVSKAAEIFQDRLTPGGTASSPPTIASTQPSFSANNILPRKPFLVYEDTATSITSIVIIPTDESCYISIPSTYSDMFANATLNAFTDSTLVDDTYKYSSELPVYKTTQLIDQDIFINCNPVGAEDMLSPTQIYDNNTSYTSNEDAVAAANESLFMILIIIGSILVPLIMICVFWYIFKCITKYMKIDSEKHMM